MDTAALSYKRHLGNRWKSVDRVLDNIKMYCHRKVETESSYKRLCTIISHFSKNTHMHRKITLYRSVNMSNLWAWECGVICNFLSYTHSAFVITDYSEFKKFFFFTLRN